MGTDGMVGRRAVLRGMALGAAATLTSVRTGLATAAPRFAVAASDGLEAMAAMLSAVAGGALPATAATLPVAVPGNGWRRTAEAVASDAASLGLVLRASGDATPWPGGAGLVAASLPLTGPLVLWSSVPLADGAAFDGLDVGVCGAGGLGLAALGSRPVDLAADCLALALRARRITAAAPPPAGDGAALGLHRVAPYLLVAAGPPPSMRLCWLIAPALAAALAPAARSALEAALRRHLVAVLGGPGGHGPVLSTAAAAGRGVRRSTLPAVAVRAHAAALQTLAAAHPAGT